MNTENTERVSVIVNPEAGRGRGARMIPDITARFAEAGITDIRVTSAKGDENSLARSAIEHGATTLVVVGGDGTTTHVANTILRSKSDVRLAVLPAGTGNDFAKVLGTEKLPISSLARVALTPGDTRVDVGMIEDRYFLNCCGFGFDVAVLEGTMRNSWLRGKAVYLYSAVEELFQYRGIDIAVGAAAMSKHMLIVLANTEYFGGIFRIAPGARVSDGELDLIAVRDLPASRRVTVLAGAIRGNHLDHPECTMERGRSFQLSFSGPPAYETDGELHHATSANLTVTSCPAALRVVTASA